MVRRKRKLWEDHNRSEVDEVGIKYSGDDKNHVKGGGFLSILKFG
jgi:hypothetical protein